MILVFCFEILLIRALLKLAVKGSFGEVMKWSGVQMETKL